MCNVLEVKNLCKKFDKFELSDINFSLREGSVLGLIGSNGAGKTTILKLILGMYIKDSGNIYFKNNEVNTDNSLFKENIGVVLDDLYAPKDMNIIQIKRFLIKVYNNFDEKIFDKYIEKYNLPKDKKIESFSRGMKSKLSIVLAISHNPSIIIMDEPTLGLDLKSREILVEDIKKFSKEYGKSVLLCSHLIDDIEELCDELIILKNGKISKQVFKNELKGIKKENLKKIILEELEIGV